MVTLTNVGAAYDAIAASKGLGISKPDLTGVTQIEFEVFIQKVGTGTQSWQLFNVTDNAEIGVINDAGAAGDKYLTATFNVTLPGVKRLRVRAKSTVSTDDPIFYGCTLRLIRT